MTEENKEENAAKPAQPIMEFKLERVLRYSTSEDKMEGYITVKPGFLFGHDLSEPEIYEYAMACGFNQERIDPKSMRAAVEDLQKRLAANQRDEFTFTVANGLRPEKGIDGWTEFFHPVAKRVKIKEDGSADFRNTDRYVHVKKDEKIAVLFEGMAGKQGFDVFGVPVAPSPIIRAKLKIGKNVTVTSENYPEERQEKPPADVKIKVHYAAVEGVLYLTENSVSVSSELVIDKNVGLETGNVNYEGTVVVKGGVEDGTTITASGSLVVGGSIESCDLKIQEDIEAKGGIHCKEKRAIRVGGNLHAKFIENSVIEVDGDIVLEGAIIGSTVYCLGNILLNGDSGNIISSTIVCFGDISAKNIGSVSENEVNIELGFHFKNDRNSKLVAEHLKLLQTELDKDTQEIGKIKQVIQRSRGNIDEAKKEEFKEIFKKYTDKGQKVKLLEQKLESLKQGRYKHDPVHLIARGGAFPGTTVKYRNTVEKFTVFESSFAMNFIPGQEHALKSAYKAKK